MSEFRASISFFVHASHHDVCPFPVLATRNSMFKNSVSQDGHVGVYGFLVLEDLRAAGGIGRGS